MGEVMGDANLWTGSKNGVYTWMDEPLKDRLQYQNARLESFEEGMLKLILDRHSGEEIVPGVVGVPVQSEVALCGRLVCESLDGKLNEQSILLEGSRLSCNRARVQLSLSQCPRVVAFPGQIVGVVGRIGMTGMTFHVRDFVVGLPPVPVDRSRQALHMVVAAGPFCQKDGLDYTPLEEMVQKASTVKPQVLVLMGPFVDSSNVMVSSGDTVLPGRTDPSSFEEVYSQLVLPRLTRACAALRRASPNTAILIVPSLEEVLCFHPLPQPPLHLALGPDLLPATQSLLQLGVQMLPNPAHVRVGGFRVTLSSSDVLSPIVRELVLRPKENKIEEALRALLHQRTLFPAVPREPAHVSEARSAALDFPDGIAPDLCVFPSVLGLAKAFVDDSVFLNSGMLCRGALGSFAEINIAAAVGTPLRERVKVDVQKLVS